MFPTSPRQAADSTSSSTDVRVISIEPGEDVRGRVWVEVRLSCLSLPGASSKRCLLWKAKPEFWTESVCAQAVKNMDARLEGLLNQFEYFHSMKLNDPVVFLCTDAPHEKIPLRNEKK